MTRKDLATKVAEALKVTKKRADEVVSAVLDNIYSGACIDGICRAGKHVFKKITRKARICSNPRTGEKIEVPEKQFVSYKRPAV